MDLWRERDFMFVVVVVVVVVAIVGARYARFIWVCTHACVQPSKQEEEEKSA